MADDMTCPFVKAKGGMNDDEYFEALTGEVFRVIIGIKPVIARWRNIKRAFENFSIEKVAAFDDIDVERLMSETGIVRNRKKIWATIRNAREFLELKREYGSFESYLRSFKGDTERLIVDLDRRLHYVGESSIRRFLGCVVKRAA